MKTERASAAADGVADARGFQPDGAPRSHGTLASIEDSASCIDPSVARKHRRDSSARDYEVAVAEMVNAARAFVQAPPKDAPHNTYIAQSVPDPTAAGGRDAIGHDYVALPASGLPRVAPFGFRCEILHDPSECVEACQARAFDVGGLGFSVERNPQNGDAVCTPITTAAGLSDIRKAVASTPQHPALPGGSWKASIAPGSTPRMEGDVLVAQLRAENGDTQTARTRVTDPKATYSNYNGTFRQDLNGDAGLAAITIAEPPPGLKNVTLNANLLVMSTDDGKSYSATVEPGDVVKFQPAKTRVACSSDAECKAAGLPTWVDGVARPGAYHCPGPGDHCFDPSSGQYAEVGQLTVTHGHEPALEAQLERTSYSLNYERKPIDTKILGRVDYVDSVGSAPIPDRQLSWDGQSYKSVGPFRPVTGTASGSRTQISCENACSASQTCRGYSFIDASEAREAECYPLSSADWPHGARVYDKDAKMMVKLPRVNGLGPGCPLRTTVGAASEANPERVTRIPAQGCGVPGILAEHSAAVEAAGARFGAAERSEAQGISEALKKDDSLRSRMALAATRTKAQLDKREQATRVVKRDEEQAFQARARAGSAALQARSDGARYLLWAGIAAGIVAAGAAALGR